ncbi:hypothetical protein CXF97_20235 [Pseudomonas sp. Choline-02u-1]|nr:hypothetical protein CXF97_20235 [Pseudomonas sp. Choline-02u-1]
MIVPTLCVVTPPWTLRVCGWDAERPGLHSHAERGNDQRASLLANICAPTIPKRRMQKAPSHGQGFQLAACRLKLAAVLRKRRPGYAGSRHKCR